jgi:hypothetical protein
MNDHRKLIAALTITIIFAATVSNQTSTQNRQGPTGGKTSDSAAPAEKKVTPKPATTETKATKPARTTTPTRNPPRATGGAASVSGKWWTTGNDFPTSEILLEQNGNLVSGAIMYADGRTGTFSGVKKGHRINYTWTNSAGERGSGWLEQSWNLFLGGSYRDQKGAEGSWTLTRIAGNWCFGGSRDRIRRVNHNSRGQVFFVTEDNGQEAGHMDGPWLFLHGDSGNVKGVMDYRGNKMEFESGTFWTWCGN